MSPTIPQLSAAYPIEVAFPDIRRFAEGNTGIPYIFSFDSGKPGPHVLVNSLMHGNEVSGAIAVAGLLDHGLRPRRGKLTLCFANVEAYHSFDPDRPDASRFIDQDLNRVWSPEILDDSSRTSSEIRRARQMRPVIASVDFLLDLHSMHEYGPPMIVCTGKDKHMKFARKLGAPANVICDTGHRDGRRMIDYGDFDDDNSPRDALAVETGHHWQPSSVAVARDTAARFVLVSGIVEREDLPDGWLIPEPAPQRFIRVTEPVVAPSMDFRFTQPFTGLETFAEAGTVFAYQDGKPVATPWNDCVLVMPSVRQLIPGVTVVRLGREMDQPSAP
jgi:predicted deacylase